MVGSVRLESSSGGLIETGFVSNCSNGYRGNYSGAAFDRIGNIRGDTGIRLLNSGISTSQGSGNSGLTENLPPLSQCLLLEPITMATPRYPRPVELKKALGFSSASSAENNSFGDANSKTTVSVGTEELKRLKANIADACFKAKGRTKRLDESLHRLNKYCDVLNLKKLQRNEQLGIEQSGGSNLLRMSTQIHRNPPNYGTQRLEERTKNVVLNKRVRTSVAESRGEGRSSGLPRQAVLTGKDKDLLKDGGAASDIIEEKNSRFPNGEKECGRKIKSKRSVGPVFTRLIDSNGEVKRTLPNKVGSDRALQTGDPHGLRSNTCEDSHIVFSSSPRIGKASRTLRTGTIEGLEQPENLNRVPYITGPSNRKRPSPTEWSGQRSQKISRSRRENLIYPVSNHDQEDLSIEICSKDSPGIKKPYLAKSFGNDTQQVNMKLQHISSPTRLSVHDESGAGCESQSKEKRMNNGGIKENTLNPVQNFRSSVLPLKKNKSFFNGEIKNGIHRPGRTGRVSPSSRGIITPAGDNLEIATMTKPIRIVRPSSDRNGSNTGRPPLKKPSDRKAVSRNRLILNSGSQGSTGEWDDDREELLEAAKFACKFNHNASTGSFWKKMEPLFASVDVEHTSFLKQQLEDAEELSKCLKQNFSDDNDAPVIVELVHDPSVELVNPLPAMDVLCNRLDSESYIKDGLYGRVLSALIVEDEIETCEDITYDMDFVFGHSNHNLCSVDRPSCNGGTRFNRGTDIHKTVHGDDLLQGCHFTRSNVGILQKDASGILTLDRQFETSLDENILLELQSIGLYPESVPDLEDGDSGMLNQEIIKLETELCEKVGRKKARLSKLCKTVEEEKELEKRTIEQTAMDKLVELTYKKHLTSRGSNASKSGIGKVPKQSALGFVKRTFARCQRFENTGKSFFDDPALRDAICAVTAACTVSKASNPTLVADNTNLGPGSRKSHHGQENAPSGPSLPSGTGVGSPEKASAEAFVNHTSSSWQTTVKNGRISCNRGKRKALLDDFRSSDGSGGVLADGATGRRSGRDRDKNASIPKSKPKPKEDQNSVMTIQESFSPLLELSAGNEDLTSWLNFDEANLQDHDSMGLEIPMDDLSDLNMLL